LQHPTPRGESAFVFNFNVTLNRDLDVTGIFCGDLDVSHDAGCAFAREVAMQRVREPFDIVRTTNSRFKTGRVHICCGGLERCGNSRGANCADA